MTILRRIPFIYIVFITLTPNTLYDSISRTVLVGPKPDTLPLAVMVETSINQSRTIRKFP